MIYELLNPVTWRNTKQSSPLRPNIELNAVCIHFCNNNKQNIYILSSVEFPHVRKGCLQT